MAKNETTRQPGWLNKSEMAKSLGISPQAFDKWGVDPVTRIGREAFYRVQDVVQNRLDNAAKKQQPGSGDGEVVDALIEYKLLQEKLRLTTAQAYAVEQKNQINDKVLIPAPFVTFALEKIASKIGSKLETVGKTISRRHPDIDARILETTEREIALARNIASQLGDELPGFLDEYLATLD
ncbi:terminase small subunit [Pseudomonas sp. NPDC090755]|uniref:terminase small subunit n=1 Tax=Pseudomonas sp. NPDC090755 TaxID=3364481 RepID=UPI00383A69BA